MNYHKSMPVKIKILIFLCFIVPFVFNRPNGLFEVLWALTVVPPLFFAWYFGLKGGIIAAIFTSLSLGLWEVFEYVAKPEQYAFHNVWLHLSLFSTIFISAIGVGIFSEKMRSLLKSMEAQKSELEQTNSKLQKYVAQQKLMEHKILSIIEFLPDATFVVDKEMKVIAWNRATEEMTGVSKKDMLGKGDYAYALPFYGVARPQLIDLVFRDNSEIAQKYDYILKKGNTLYTEVFVPCINGGKGAYVWGTASAILDDHGEVVGAIESIRDITDKKKLDTELREHRNHLEELVNEQKKAEEKLKESEQRYRSLVELNPQPIIVHEQGIIVYANPAARDFPVFVKIKDIVGKSIFEFHEPEVNESIINRMEKTIKEGPQFTELKVKDPNNELINLELTSVSIQYQGNVAIMTIFQDVTDRKRTEEVSQRYTEVLKNEMELAAKVQLSLLPTKLPEIKGYSFAWEFKPSSFISGDMFNIFVIDQNHFGFYMLDVMGHGLAAALQAVSISYILKPSFIKSAEISIIDELLIPSQALERLNNNFTKNQLSGDFFTIFYGVVNTRSLELIYARAGHPAPMILTKEGKIDELAEGGLPIGLFNEIVYENYYYNLKSGDKLLLYTDGVIENLDKNKSAKDEFFDFLSERKYSNIEQLLKSILERSIPVEKDVQEDDIALLGIEMI